MVKRYVAEAGSDHVRDAMGQAEGWFMCRAGFVETARAVGLVAGPAATNVFTGEWPAFGIVEIDQQLADRAAALALDRDLRTLDALHLAAALLLPREELVFATWDRRLNLAASAEGLQPLPKTLD